MLYIMAEEGRRRFTSLRWSWGAVRSSAEADQDPSRNTHLISKVPSARRAFGITSEEAERELQIWATGGSGRRGA